MKLDETNNRADRPAITLSPENKDLQITLDYNLNFIEIKGWSISENVGSRYEALLTEMKTLIERDQSLIVSFKYEMFNTTTVKYVLSIMKLMNRAYRNGKKVKAYWRVNANRNDEMTEVGFDLSLMCDFDFQIITDDSSINTKLIDDQKAIQHRKFMFKFSRTNRSAA